MYRYLGILCAIVSLTGCCNCRTSIDADELRPLTVGQTTQDDVKAKFGTPSETATKDGETVWTYSFIYQDQSWATSIPVVGGFVIDGWNNRNQTDSFVFDAQAKLESYTRADAVNLPGG